MAEQGSKSECVLFLFRRIGPFPPHRMFNGPKIEPCQTCEHSGRKRIPSDRIEQIVGYEQRSEKKIDDSGDKDAPASRLHSEIVQKKTDGENQCDKKEALYYVPGNRHFHHNLRISILLPCS
ncbi:MAG: hypothetical protein KGH93_01570 [Patescibacteria group bacterium]|nr:hypothetical protein [Patescibacteria group bacterium]MDE1945870.1 hypothetical protein [Patescibacteria group bacterium]